MPLVGKAEGCKDWSCDQFRAMFVYRTMYQLPAGFTCDHCKLQWYYMTGSRCWPPCKSAGGCAKPVPYGTCDQPGQSYPEEFYNCADIKIEGGGGGRKLLEGEAAEVVADFFPEI
jgi:hypothetical protein